MGSRDGFVVPTRTVPSAIVAPTGGCGGPEGPAEVT